MNTANFNSIGQDVLIAPTAVFRRPHLVDIGDHVAIDEFFVVSTQLQLGNHIHIGPHVVVIGGKDGLLRMGNFSNLSAGGTVVCGSDRFHGEGLVSVPGVPESYRDELVLDPVIFEDFANTGAQVTILPGVTLPQGVVIGTCSLVRTSDKLEPWTIYAGNPLRKIGVRPKEKIIEYARKLGY